MTWRPMSEAPRDGSSFDVKCRSEVGVEVMVRDLHYGPKPMRKRPDGSIDDELILWGAKNPLSPYLTPIGWRAKGADMTITPSELSEMFDEGADDNARRIENLERDLDEANNTIAELRNIIAELRSRSGHG